MTTRRSMFVGCVLMSLALVLAAPARVHGQIVGLEGGLSLSKLEVGGSTEGFDNLPWFTGGLFTVFSPDVITGQIELLYSVRGFKTATQKLKITSFEVPVATRISLYRDLAANVHVFAGGSLGIKLDARIEDDGVTSQIDDDFETFDFGLVLGMGAEASRFVVNGRYVHGLRNIRKDKSNPAEIKTRAIAFMVGVRFD